MDDLQSLKTCVYQSAQPRQAASDTCIATNRKIAFVMRVYTWNIPEIYRFPIYDRYIPGIFHILVYDTIQIPDGTSVPDGG